MSLYKFDDGVTPPPQHFKNNNNKNNKIFIHVKAKCIKAKKLIIVRPEITARERPGF